MEIQVPQERHSTLMDQTDERFEVSKILEGS
jgi:hypothetical protein